jgi:hypothetical protein
MKTTLHITLIVIAVAVVIYLGSAFIATSFDFTTYGEASRFFIVLFFVCFSAMFILIYLVNFKKS